MHFQDNIEEGSSTKVVDCILALKAYQEWKHMNGSNGFNKPPRSPFVVHLSGRTNTQSQGIPSSNSCRQLDVSASCDKQSSAASENQKFQGFSSLFLFCNFTCACKWGDFLSCRYIQNFPHHKLFCICIKVFRRCL